ncbi:hypothetical protein ACFOEE_06625 [Pseudoalteromonas fenneropenaei]|uniref:Uncharacterized protein n=1 Tax=Pseudoalteromonas fenneropenaei TaxID=1737459 RepID=A0ABV7CHW2_9GAMM
MAKLIYALVSEHGNNSAYQRKLRELTIAFCRYGYRDEIIEAATIDLALQQAANRDADYCLLQSAGHVIDEQWYLPHWSEQGLRHGIAQLCQQTDFLLAGEVVKGESGALGLATDCFLVNLRHYRALGMPAFGEADHMLRWQWKCTAALQSLPDVITSQQLQQIERVTDVAGSGLVTVGFNAGLVLRCFSHAINQNRFDLADSDKAMPEEHSAFAKCLREPNQAQSYLAQLSQAQSEFVRRAAKQIGSAKQGVFLLNIENYTDLDAEPKGAPLDAVFSVAAGFKIYYALAKMGFHANTEVVFFDYSEKALAVRQYMVNHWDGADFPAFVRHLFDVFPEPETFYQLWFNTHSRNINWQDLEQLWQNELTRWGGAAAFQNQWQVWRKLPHRYLHVDLLAAREELLAALQHYEHSYIWWSNAFFTIYSHWHFNASAREQHYLQWLLALADVAPNCRINGADHHNSAVNCTTAAKYAAHTLNAHHVELHPTQFPSVAMSF